MSTFVVTSDLHLGSMAALRLCALLEHTRQQQPILTSIPFPMCIVFHHAGPFKD
jgi:hypothetical protein